MSDPGGPAPGEMRISDRERQAMIDELRAHCVEGRLTLDEFSDRVGQALASTGAAELAGLTADLPAPETAPERRARQRPRRWLVGILNADKMTGRWRPAGRLRAVAALGNCVVDFRQAVLDGDEVTVTAWVFMGNVKVLVPEGIEVELSGPAIMGNRRERGTGGPILPGSPLVRVRSRVFMGNVKVQGVAVGAPDPDGAGRRVQEPPALGPGADDLRIPPSGAAAERARLRAERRELRDRERHERRERHGRPAAADVEVSAQATMSQAAAPDGTVTILFSDIEGFTPILERLGDERAYELLRRHNEIVRAQVQACGGYEVKTAGDGFMVAFSSARRALRCAVEIQRDLELRARSNPDELPLKVRIGLHTGEAINDAEDFFGRTVNLASRITNEAGGGHVLASSLVRQLAGAVDGISFDDGRPVDLRGINGDQVVHEVTWQAPATEPGPATA